MATCLRCNRPLKNPRAIALGYGPVCYRKMLRESEYSDKHLDEPVESGFHMTRIPNGQLDLDGKPMYDVATNVPHVMVVKSDDFEWGYGGSGPHELALNIIEVVLRREGYQGDTIELDKGQLAFNATWVLRSEFVRDYISQLPYMGGHIPYEVVKEWIYERLA